MGKKHIAALTVMGLVVLAMSAYHSAGWSHWA